MSRPVVTSSHSLSARVTRRRKPVAWWWWAGGIAAVGGLLLFGYVGYLLVARYKQADPIPGVTIVVHPGNAVSPESIDHAAHAYLNRRLRAAGYENSDVLPLAIQVRFEKIGSIDYQLTDKTVSADQVQLQIDFHDASGRLLHHLKVEPKMYSTEEYKYDAEISLNQAAYGRAVGQILHIDIPSPAQLKRGAAVASVPDSVENPPRHFFNQADRPDPNGPANPSSTGNSKPPIVPHPPRQPQNPELLKGLMVHLPLDQADGSAIADTVSPKSPGTVDGEVHYVGGPVDTAFGFDGDTYLDLGAAAPLERTDAFTICAWINRSSDKGMKIVSRLDDQERGYDLALIHGVVWFQLLHDVPENCLQVTADGLTGMRRWHHLAATYDGSSLGTGVWLYIDGQLAAAHVRRDGLTDTIRSDAHLTIGRHTNFRYRHFEGAIDDVRIYNRALSAEEVADLYKMRQR